MSQPQSGAMDGRLDALQVLRGFAAVAIVIHHARIFSGTFFKSSPNAIFFPLDAGVDVFFVLSGFIMVYSSRRMFGRNSAPEFIRRRLLRILPLYWSTTTAWLLIILLKSALGSERVPGLQAIITSYLFIPYDSHGTGALNPFPLLDLGWTLNYEMFFYVIFSLFLWLRRSIAVFCLAGAMAALAVVHSLVHVPTAPLHFWTQPIILEFAAGALLGHVYLEGVRIGRVAQWAMWLAALGIWGFVQPGWIQQNHGAGFYSWARVLVYGSGALLLVAGAALGRVPFRSPLALIRLGDASYALYLVHPFVILGTGVVVERAALPSGFAVPAAIWIVAASIVVAAMIHFLLERPLLGYLGRITAPVKRDRTQIVDVAVGS